MAREDDLSLGLTHPTGLLPEAPEPEEPVRHSRQRGHSRRHTRSVERSLAYWAHYWAYLTVRLLGRRRVLVRLLGFTADSAV